MPGWLAQLVGSLTLDFGLSHDLVVVEWSLTLGSVLSAEFACPSPFALPPTPWLPVSFSLKKNK